MSQDDSFDRRHILKAIGGAAAGGASLAASGVASAERSELEKRYDDRASLLDAFREHAADLPAALADAGVVDEEFDFERLDVEVDPAATKVRPTDDDGRAGVTVTQARGPRSALGMISTSTDDHGITLYVQPQRDESYAVVEPEGDEDDFAVRDDGDVTVLQCMGSECTCERCYNPNGVGYYLLEELTCDVNCRNCVVTGTSCECTEWC